MKYYNLVIGLFLLIANNKILILLNIPYEQIMSLLFYVIGISLVVYSISLFLKDNTIKRIEENKQLLETIGNLVSKEDKETIVDNLQNMNKKLDLIFESQKEEDKIIESYSKQILDLINQLPERVMEELSDPILNAGLSSIDRDNINYIVKNLEGFDQKMSIAISNLSSTIEEIKRNQSDLSKLPQLLVESMDEVCDNEKKTCNTIEEKLIDMTDNIDSNYSNLSNTIKDLIDDMWNVFDNYDQQTCEKLEQLSGQYESFRNFTERTIKQLTLMSEQDINTLKGIMGDGQ